MNTRKLKHFRVSVAKSAQHLFLEEIHHLCRKMCILNLLCIAEFSNCSLLENLFNNSDPPSLTFSCPLHAYIIIKGDLESPAIIK